MNSTAPRAFLPEMSELPTVAPAADPTPPRSAAACVELDARALAELSQLDPGGAGRLVHRVLVTYQGSLARLVQQLTAAMTTGDLATVRLSVHTLKSSSASVGALALSDMCAQAELAVRQERTVELPALIERLLTEAEQVRLAVQRKLSD